MKKRIPINTKDSIYFIFPDEVVYCKSEYSSTIIFLENSEIVTVSIEINDIEKLLKGNNFIRPHQSYLVNRNFVKRIDMDGDYALILTNQMTIPLANQRRDEILNLIKTTPNRIIENLNN